MEYLRNNGIKNEVIDALIEKLDNSMDFSCYACDLAYKLFEGDNIDGVCWYVGASYKENDDFIKKYWDDLPEIIDELKFNFDGDYFKDILYSVFDNSCKFVLVIFLEVASYLIGQCDFIQENWDNEITLNDENVKIIVEQLESKRD